MKIGVLGGTFNPPHIGHIILAEQALQKLGLKKVFFIPTNISPHKEKDKVDAQRRFDMVKSAITGKQQFEALDLEIKRGGLSYTIDTIKALKKTYPQDEFFLIIGSDLANNIHTWKNFAELKKEIKIAVAQRANSPLKSKNGFMVIDITQIDVSSSQIRDVVRRGESVKELVGEEVLEYIETHGLYKNT